MEFVNATALLTAIATELIDTGNLLDAAEVRLFTNDIQPTAENVVGDFTAPTYTGAGDEAVTWLAPSIADDGTVEAIGTLGEFRPTDAVTPNTVYGAILLSAGGAYLMGARFEDGPLPMESAADAILLTMRYRPGENSIGVVIS